jgi:hypothetical protein
MLRKQLLWTWLLRSVLLPAFLTLFVGCSSKGTVSGKVFYQGNPLPGGRVTFLQEHGAFHSVIHEDGSYRITGIPPGPATITVSSPDPPGPATPSPMEKAAEMAKARKVEMSPEMAKLVEEGMKHIGDPEAGKRKYMSIPPKYKDPEQSGLKYTVKSGVQEYDIQLK